MIALIAAAMLSNALPAPDDVVPKARDVLAQTLDHYPETRFRNVRAVARKSLTDDTVSVQFCGEIDGPNRFGGRTGYKAFVLRPNFSFSPLFIEPADGCRGERIDDLDYSAALNPPTVK